MGRQRGSSTRQKSFVTGVAEPPSSKARRDGLGQAIISVQPSLTASVKEIGHGNPDRYPTVQKAYESDTFHPDKDEASLQLVNKRAGIHLKLYKEDSLEGIANFKFVSDGEFTLEARVFKTTRCIEIFKHSKVSKKKSIYWVMGLGRDRDGSMVRTREFWDTLCHYFQKLSLEQLQYVNLPRRENLLGGIAQQQDARADLTSEDIQDTLVLFIHGDGGIEGSEWVFINWFARPEFTKKRREILEGQVRDRDGSIGERNESREASPADLRQKSKPKKRSATNRTRRRR